MKIRAQKKTVLKVCRLLTEDVYEIYPNMNFGSMANRHRAEEALKIVQKKRIVNEPQVKEWQFPVECLFVTEHTGLVNLHVSVVLDWEKDNLLYLDFDAPYAELRY